MKLAITLLLVSATSVFAQDCPVCTNAAKLRDELRTIDPGNAEQRARGEALSRDGVKLVTDFGANPPPLKQGRRVFEALIGLGGYAAPFSPNADYEKAVAAITAKDAEYRKLYQAMMRKGMRARDRREACQVRYLQTNVTMQECRLQEMQKGATDDLANRRCSATYALAECMAKRK